MVCIDACDIKKINKLEQLDLKISTKNMNINIEWFRAINHYTLPNNNWHAHSCLEIHFITEGSVAFHFTDESIEVSAGYAILIPANYPHCLENTTHETYFRYILNVSIEPLNEDPEAMFLYNTLEIKKPISIPIYGNIISHLESCLNESDERINGFLTNIQCSIQMILVSLARELTHAQKACYYVVEKSNYDKQRAEHIARYIEQSLSVKITIEDIAEYIHLSTKQVQRIIQNQYGLTVKQLMMRLCLKKVKELMKDSDLSIGIISNMLGFSNEQCFSRFFRKMEGQAPSQYRNGIMPRQLL